MLTANNIVILSIMLLVFLTIFTTNYVCKIKSAKVISISVSCALLVGIALYTFDHYLLSLTAVLCY